MASLLGLARAEQEHAKRLLRHRLIAHGATIALGWVSILVPDPWVYMVAVFALLTEIAAWWLRASGRDAQARAEAGSRRALVEKELGDDPDSLGTALLTTEFSEWACQNARQWDDPNYYATTGPVGPNRLRAALQESAFWSSQLYRTAARRRLIGLGGLLIVVLAGVLAVVAVESADAGTFAARAVTVALATLITADEASVILSQFAAARVADRVLRQLDDTHANELGPMLVSFGDYWVARATSDPIPTRLYQSHRDRIEAAWQARVSTGASDATGR